jgi:hypothetical protein
MVVRLESVGDEDLVFLLVPVTPVLIVAVIL